MKLIYHKVQVFLLGISLILASYTLNLHESLATGKDQSTQQGNSKKHNLTEEEKKEQERPSKKHKTDTPFSTSQAIIPLIPLNIPTESQSPHVLAPTFPLAVGEVSSVTPSSHRGSPQIEPNERPEPPFFRIITTEGRHVYILGSPHTIKIKELFDSKVIEEIEEIKRNAILYTEHEPDNRKFLELLDREENQIDAQTLSQGMNIFSVCETRPSKQELEKLNEQKFMINSHERSSKSFKEVLKAQPWLGALILGTHSNILYYNLYGGTEHDLTDGEFSTGWKEKHYLETSEQVAQIYKDCNEHEQDQQENINWI